MPAYFMSLYYPDNILRLLPTSSVLWSHGCYWRKACSSLALWLFHVVHDHLHLFLSLLNMEMHSLVDRKCRSLLLYKSDPVRDYMVGFRELKYCLIFISTLIFVLHYWDFITSLNKDFMQQWIPGDLEIQPLQGNIDCRITQIPIILWEI